MRRLRSRLTTRTCQRQRPQYRLTDFVSRKVADLSKLVLHVDLWNVDATREDNCVKHASQTSPNISSVITAAYPQVNAQRNPPTFPYNDPGYGSHYQNGYEPATRAFTHGSVSSAIQMPMPRSSQDVTALREGSVARNLIGSASACAVRLEYPEGKVGIWFVLQDLSVRTEGWFRLKMSLFNLAEFVINEDVNVPTPTNRELYTEAPCLSMAFSQPFRVYSAKKFPGVMETTPLSQAFASQGIKIPIRKPDGNKKRKAGDEEDPEDESPEDGNYDE